jgi:hypothetical protein
MTDLTIDPGEKSQNNDTQEHNGKIFRRAELKQTRPT